MVLKLNFFQTLSTRVGQDFEVEVQQDFETGLKIGQPLSHVPILPILNISQLWAACSQLKTHIGTMLSIRMVGVGKIMRSSEDP